MRGAKRVLGVVVVAGAGLLVVAPARAVSQGADFGQHVRMCAQMTGFDGMHNPGMHQGRSGWEPDHDCMDH